MICECRESISRRSFLKATAILSFAALPDLALAASPSRGRLLVLLLRGGMDGLTAMPAVGDPGLKGKRRHLIPDGLLKLDGFFALHPSLKNIHGFFRSGQALLVHGTSNPYTGRSHFEGQDIMESGMTTAYSSSTGWLGRALDVSGHSALTMSLPVPLILRGKTVAESRYPGWISMPPRSVYEKLAPFWAADADIAESGAQLAMPPAKMELAMAPAWGQTPDLVVLATQAGERLREANGPRVAIIDFVGFDTHASQPGTHAEKLANLDQIIGTFAKVIGQDVWKDTLVVTVTEFGRTVAENGSAGTDHGWGTCAFVVGGALRKGGIVADWPGLKPKDLFQGRDLRATLDSRALYATIAATSLGLDPQAARRDVLSFDGSNPFTDYLL